MEDTCFYKILFSHYFSEKKKGRDDLLDKSLGFGVKEIAGEVSFPLLTNCATLNM
jgi:hypothetical protein